MNDLSDPKPTFAKKALAVVLASFAIMIYPPAWVLPFAAMKGAR